MPEAPSSWANSEIVKIEKYSYEVMEYENG